MFGIRLLQVILVICALWAIITQMLIPQIKGTPWFPFRNRYKNKAEADLAKAKEELEVTELSNNVRQIRAKIGRRSK